MSLPIEDSVQVGVRMSKELKKAVQEAARRSGWSVSDQIRYELSYPRGMWKPRVPYLPTPPEKP